MFRRLFPPPSVDASDEPGLDPGTAVSDGRGDGLAAAAADGAAAVAPDLRSLPIVGITRRRMAALVGVLIAVWIIFTFARQVSEASAATARADEIAAANVMLSDEVAALDRELDLIARQQYIEQQARGYGLGSAKEIPFTLDGSAPALGVDAPGSAAVRVGAGGDDVPPLERWLTLLFGPTD